MDPITREDLDATVLHLVAETSEESHFPRTPFDVTRFTTVFEESKAVQSKGRQ